MRYTIGACIRSAEYLFRYLVVHPHIEERLISAPLFFKLFLYDLLVPQDFRLLHPRDAAPQHRRRVQERPLRVVKDGVEDFLRHRVHLPVLHQRRAADSLNAQAVFQPCRYGPRPGLVIAFIGVGDEVRLGMPLGLCEGVAALAAHLPAPEVVRMDALVLPALPHLRVLFRHHLLHPLELLPCDDGLVLSLHDDALQLPLVLPPFLFEVVRHVFLPVFQFAAVEAVL